MRTWADTDANGAKLTDGRLCLVIKSDTDPTMPEVRIYGKDKEEILDKAAKTVETAQAQIHRLRSTPAPTPARSSAVTPTDMANAVANLNNPAKAGEAVTTILKSVGVDVHADAQRAAARKIGSVCAAWEKTRPEFPNDPRNQRILVDRAIILAGGKYLNVTDSELDAAFEELTKQEMFFEVKPVQPGGNPDSRTEPARNATSYRRNALRSPEPAPRVNEKEAEKHARWRTILEKGHGKALEDAMRNEPGFTEWVDKQYAKTA